VADKVYFGVPGNIQEIPYPKSGMGFDSNVDTEVTELVSGGRSVYRAPTAFKTLDMNWTSTSAKLAHLIDMYNGQFGPGPFYISDPSANQFNVLPPRWANSWQLAHQSNGWCRPVIQTGYFQPASPDWKQPLSDRRVKFTQAAAGTTVKLEGVLRTRLIRIPGKGYWLAAYGSATGGAGIRVRGFNAVSKVWDTFSLFTTFTGVPVNVIPSVDSTYTMIELDLYMPLGSTLILKGLALSTLDYSVGIVAPRTNWIANPSLETNATGYTFQSSTSLSRDTTEFMFGTASLKAVSTIAAENRLAVWGATGGAAANADSIPVTVGQQVTFSVYVKRPAGSLTHRAKIHWFNAAGAFIMDTDGTYTAVGNAWTRISVTGTAPANAAKFGVAVLCSNVSTVYLDGWLAEISGTLDPYFDGSTVAGGGASYVWAGTPHASRSDLVPDPGGTPTPPWMPRGSGIGAVQFGNDAGSELVSSTIDRIGLSLTMTEVQNVESVML
jgi:hypothetical protein